MVMRVLLVASAYNSLTQRVHVELADRGHEVSVELAVSDEVLREGVARQGSWARSPSPRRKPAFGCTRRPLLMRSARR